MTVKAPGTASDLKEKSASGESSAADICLEQIESPFGGRSLVRSVHDLAGISFCMLVTVYYMLLYNIGTVQRPGQFITP